MSLQTVRDRVNIFLSNRWPVLVSRQDAYFATHGRYWQGLWSHNTEIDQTTEDADRVADALTSKPTDQSETWRDRFGTALDSVQFPARLRIDTYKSPRGHGWSATVQIRYNGTIYERSQGVGPDADQYTHGWRVVE